MNGLRRALGILLIIAELVVVAAGYRYAPSVSARVMANGMALDLGKPTTCPTTPSASYYVTAAASAILPCGRRLTRSS